MQFKVQKTSMYGTKADGTTDYSKLVPAFKAVGYSGPGVNFPTESKPTLSEAEATMWAEKASVDEDPPEAGFASYSDD